MTNLRVGLRRIVHLAEVVWLFPTGQGKQFHDLGNKDIVIMLR